MYNYMNTNSNYNYNNYIQDNRNFVKNALQKGINLMDNPLLDDNLVSIWVEYVEEILKICVQNTQSNVYITFLELKISIHSNNVKPFHKLKIYLDFLFEVYEFYNYSK